MSKKPADNRAAIARQHLREAFYRSYHDLNVEGTVEGIVDAVEEYVSARLVTSADQGSRPRTRRPATE
jgi:hypothetical protein